MTALVAAILGALAAIIGGITLWFRGLRNRSVIEADYRERLERNRRLSEHAAEMNRRTTEQSAKARIEHDAIKARAKDRLADQSPTTKSAAELDREIADLEIDLEIRRRRREQEEL